MVSKLPLMAVVLAVSGLASCGNNGCEEVRESYCLATLQSHTGATITSMNGWGIGQIGAGSNDSITMTDMMFALSSPADVELILNPNDSVTRILLEMKTSYYGTVSQQFDTLTLHYQAAPYFIDMECGCTVTFTLTAAEVTGHFLQSVSIQDPLVTNETTTNLKIEY